jgi:hypothetical protein
MWRIVVTGHDNAVAALRKLAADSPNEFQVIHLPTKDVLATANEKKDFWPIDASRK